MIDKWKKAVYSDKVFGTVLTNLSKEFECICYDLLIAKLSAYGLSLPSLKLIRGYFQNRKQRTIQYIHPTVIGKVLIQKFHKDQYWDSFCSISFYVTCLLKMKTITLKIKLMIDRRRRVK